MEQTNLTDNVLDKETVKISFVLIGHTEQTLK